MLPLSVFNRLSIVLWLMFFFDFVDGVVRCYNCYDDPSTGAPHDTADCPWITGVAANVTALTGAAASLLVVDKLLPTKLLRVFPKAVLGTLKAIASRPSNGAAPELTEATTLKAMVAAIQCGSLTKEDVILHLSCLLSDLGGEAADEVKRKKYKTMLSAVEHVTPRVGSSSAVTGRFVYILARLSSVVCTKSVAKFELCIECEPESSSSSSSSSSASSSSTSKAWLASLSRPKSFAQMACLLNHFALVATATGSVSTIALLPFLDDVVWEPVRLGTLSWPVAFELLLIYLNLVENSDKLTISTVYESTGGMDAKRAEAEAMAQGNYSADCFRAHGWKPGDRTVGDDNVDRSTGKKPGNEPYVGTVIHSKTTGKGCTAWNLHGDGATHLKKHVGTGGVCLFRDCCDQFVTDKGPGGQCNRAHRRPDCDYPQDKRCNKPVKA